MAIAIGGRAKHILLLGVTPELSCLGNKLTAVDSSAQMIADIWPGDNEHRDAVLADWADVPVPDSAFDAVIGDGSLNCAPDCLEQVLTEIRRVLSPEGVAAFRVFCAPSEAESFEDIELDVLRGSCANVHALKWRIAMALAASAPNASVPAKAILARFNAMFPDRSRLSSICKWSVDEIATLDAYDGASHSLCFPTEAEIVKLGEQYLGPAKVFTSSGYPLAERCPTISWSANN
jgi:SAM-dependent methyltransferase